MCLSTGRWARVLMVAASGGLSWHLLPTERLEGGGPGGGDELRRARLRGPTFPTDDGGLCGFARLVGGD